MEKKLKRIKPYLYHYEGDPKVKILGFNSRLFGDSTALHGNCTAIFGNCSGLYGDCTGIFGNCSGIYGNFDNCFLTEDERKSKINIKDLVED